MTELSTKYVKEYFWQTRVRKILIFVAQIAAVVALAFVCAYFFGQRVVISENSMEPTLESGDKVFMNTAIYKFSSPARGDIIAFRTSDDTAQSMIIKRIVALPGETIKISGGQIIIDGEIYTGDTQFAKINDPGLAENEITLDSDEYFVLGDNRNDSEDSRHVDIGLVKEEYIVGKLWLRYSPMDRFSFLD